MISLINIAALIVAGVPFLHGGEVVQGQPPAPAPEQPITQVVSEEMVAEIIVGPGDNLSKIAKKYDTTWKRIYNANETIKHPDMINPGDKIRIPNENEDLKERPLPNGVTISIEVRSKKQSSSKPQKNYPVISGDSVWDRLAQCESGGNWSINTGNGYYGGLQFSLSTWQSVGGSGYPNQASRAEQIARAKILQARSGWGAWPACATQLGLL